jgi:uncharacterized protein YfaS (alpha-2-macroglobulin family)
MSRFKLLPLTSALLAIIFLFSCETSDSKKPKKINPEFRNYISAFTSGVISAESVIKIKLRDKLSGELKVGEQLDMDLFEFSPKIKGAAFLTNEKSIEFRPEEPMVSGQTYEAEFNLFKLVDVNNDLKVFEFQFRTIDRSFNVVKGEFTPYNNKDLTLNQLSGYVSLTDVMNLKDVEKILIAKYNGREFPINWQDDGHVKRFPFTIDSIPRTDEKGQLVLVWDGKPLKIKSHGSDTTFIPSLADFMVMGITVVQQPEQYFSIQFSDPLLSDQNLDGIVHFEKGGNLKLDIENNIVKAYPPERLTGAKTVIVETGVKNLYGYKMKNTWTMEVSFEKIKPAVELIGKGNIIPSSDGLIFPFRAVNLNAVDVKVVKIFEKNIMQFFQENNLSGSSEIKRVGRPVHKEKISLTSNPGLDLGKWNTFSIDLTNIIKDDPGAIYQVELSFRKEYSRFNCSGTEGEVSSFSGTENLEMSQSEMNYWDNPDYYWYSYYPKGFSWNEKDNPCNVSYYYSGRWVKRNVLSSNLGIIAKGGEDHMMKFAVTDLRTTEALSNVSIELYDYQQQKIEEITTDKDGMAEIDLRRKPFLLVAKRGEDRGYLRLDDGSSLSVSMFNVSGKRVQKGIKGYIYGERGVWRPGDTLFLTFILEDKNKTLPAEHPVSFELKNPAGQMVSHKVKMKGMNGFYQFTIKTDADAPTGSWIAKVDVGGVVFTKRIRIETVKPNRLKISLDYGTEKLSVSDKNKFGDLKVKWLHGATARNLKANVTVTLKNSRTSFENYKGFHFTDPTKSFYADEEVIFDKKINELGEAKVKADLGVHKNAPGMLKAEFMVRAFEEGGDFSTDFFSIPYAPYKVFVGIKLPEGDDYGTLTTDSTYTAEVVTIDADGNPISVSGLNVYMHKIRWRWWWDVSNEYLGNYSGRYSRDQIMSRTISTKNGKGKFSFKVDYPDWGRFMLRVEDPMGGHATGVRFYADWPDWVSRSNRTSPGGAAILTFSTDKDKYEVGEMATVTIPTSGKGRALVSIESGSKIVDAYWILPEEGTKETQFNFAITEEMCPNVYVNVTYIQPHAQTANDLPIRLYGIVPIEVEDPGTILSPQIKMPDELKPEKEFTIKVSEKDNKPMTYTIAVVDDGLLDLTRFKTPDPWSAFFAHEALGVKTWDIYDYVLGAYGGKMEKLFAIGGDEGELNKDKQKANRFKPVVMFLGPFELKGGTQSHTLKMPRYSGSVRTMVIAGNGEAYGFTEKTTPVRNPLMILATLPRVLGPGESVKLPVTVFAMKENVKNVKITLQTNDILEIQGGNEQSVSFGKTGDKVINFDLKVAERIGIGKVTLIATSGKEKATYEIELDVRNPNPPVVDYIEGVVRPGESWEMDYTPVGIEGTNEGLIEISGIPPIDFGKRLKYLVKYPYGCSEQTTSAAFPQLYLADVMELDNRMKDWNQKNVKSAINDLGFMQLSNGGFRYWPNAVRANDWVSSYIGHFMMEAERKGYVLPSGFKNNWISYQKKAARNWKYYSPKYPRYYHGSHLTQAYRLYTLALAGSPEMGAMNRLREYERLSVSARWRLAAAYALAGQPEAARSLTANLSTDVEAYSNMNNRTWGSPVRDMAMILETMVAMKEYDKAVPLVVKISKQLSSNRWYSTQTTAYCLMAVSKFAEEQKMADDEMHFICKIDKQKTIEKHTQLPISQFEIPIDGTSSGKVKIANKGKALLYGRVMLRGTPLAGEETFAESHIKIQVVYRSMNGGLINISKLEQGTDFIAEVKVFNASLENGYSELALTQIFPSGWEIINTRLAGFTNVHEKDTPRYRDIRDDKVYTHFNIWKKPRVFTVSLNASYRGRFYLPAVSCEAMYDNSVYARVPGQWVEVVKPGE